MRVQELIDRLKLHDPKAAVWVDVEDKRKPCDALWTWRCGDDMYVVLGPEV